MERAAFSSWPQGKPGPGLASARGQRGPPGWPFWGGPHNRAPGVRIFERQARERDRKKREEMLHQIQRILHDKKIFAPIWENGFIRGVGPRVEEPALALIPAFPYSAPYEDVRLKP
jgi:ABC-type transport system substrate-binding protein